MQVLPPTVPTTTGRDKPELGAQALAGTSNSDPNPNKQHAYIAVQPSEAGDEEPVKETLSSRLIDKSPISSETQAALLALLSEPDPTPGVRSQSFSALVNQADPGSVVKADTNAQFEEHAEFEADGGPEATVELDGDGELEAYGELEDGDEFDAESDFGTDTDLS